MMRFLLQSGSWELGVGRKSILRSAGAGALRELGTATSAYRDKGGAPYGGFRALPTL